MLSYAYAAKFLRSLAGGQGSRTASRSTAARPASGCTPIQQPRAQPAQPRPGHRQIRRWPKAEKAREEQKTGRQTAAIGTAAALIRHIYQRGSGRLWSWCGYHLLPFQIPWTKSADLPMFWQWAVL